MSIKFYERSHDGSVTRGNRYIRYVEDLDDRVEEERVPADLLGAVNELLESGSTVLSDKLRGDRFVVLLFSLAGFDRQKKWQPVG